MATNNIALSETLLAQVQTAAQVEFRSPDDLVQEAVEHHLRRKRLQKLYAYGSERGRDSGIAENRVDDVVKEERRYRAKLSQ